MRIGFIGLGRMGGPMCRNLLSAGHDLVVHDVREAAARELLAAGAAWARTPGQVAAGREIVITSLPSPREVEEVLLGSGRHFDSGRTGSPESPGSAGGPAAPAAPAAPGRPAGSGALIDGLEPGSIWIDMSTSVPAVADRVRALAEPRGIGVIDAPVSGMTTGAQAGTLQIFVGGTLADYRRARPVLEAMGDKHRIRHVGPHGAGYTVKLMLNLLWFAHLCATAEVLAVGVAAGVDLGTLRESLLASPAASHFVESDVLSVIRDGDYDEGFALALACKDLGLAVDLARATGVPVELSALVEQIYRRARAQYGDLGGEMLPIKLIEDVTGTPLRLAAYPAGTGTESARTIGQER